jgi:arylsulfatase A-like enzyme
MTLYDRGTGTPLLVRWPKKLPAGRVVDHLVSTIDIMPTMLEAAGTAKPDGVQGKSLLSIMQGHAAPAGDEVVFSEMTHHIHYLPTRAVRSRRWKYIRNYSDIAVGLDQNHHDDWAHRLCDLPNQPWRRPRVEEELYDLAEDPDEQVNLAAEQEHAKRLREMRALLRQHMVETQDPFLDAPFTNDHDPRAYERDE